jgi:hypothetical protein
MKVILYGCDTTTTTTIIIIIIYFTEHPKIIKQAYAFQAVPLAHSDPLVLGVILLYCLVLAINMQ